MTEPTPLTVVVAAVIRDHRGRILLTRRPADKHMGGLWELPGGKLQRGESPAAALERELSEELGVGTATGEPITFAVHEEAGLRILLLFFASTITRGSPRPLDGQVIEWVEPARLDRYPTPPADARLIRILATSPPHSTPIREL